MMKKILIIEDDANLLYGLQAKFSVAGFKALVNNGSSESEVMDQVRHLGPDYIILDLILPEVDGFNILKNIKSKPEISHIPIFIFTNLSDNDSQNTCKNLGAEYYFIKTDFSLDDFVKKVKKIIENRGEL